MPMWSEKPFTAVVEAVKKINAEYGDLTNKISNSFNLSFAVGTLLPVSSVFVLSALNLNTSNLMNEAIYGGLSVLVVSFLGSILAYVLDSENAKVISNYIWGGAALGALS